MNYTLHKLETGFIVTSDEEIKEGDLVLNSLNCIQSFLKDYNDINAEKIIAQEPNIIFSDLKEEEQKKIGWFDVRKKANTLRSRNSIIQHPDPHTNVFESGIYQGYCIGFKEAQELLSDRMFTEEQVRKSLLEVALWGKVSTTRFEDVEKIIQSLSQKSWPVELEMETCETYNLDECNSRFSCCNQPFKPKLTDGKVKILKLL